jgi:predicted nucleotidyltransferase
MVSPKIQLPEAKISNFCERWKISELALFGSVLRNDFRPDSDLDVLVTFSFDADWSLFDHVQMQQELAKILERKVDLVSKRAIERSQNWIRRREILETAKIIYVK